MKLSKVLSRTLLALLFIASVLTSAHAAAPVANAGPDIIIADYDGDESVTLRLNASASTDADGDIVSYAWTWPGQEGTMSGQVTEGVFPVRNGAITVTLTVTDSDENSTTDTLEVSVYDRQTALFTDFPSLAFINATVSGETLVVDSQVGSTRVYRRNGGGWAETPYASSNNDDLAVGTNTIFGGTFYSGTGFSASHYNGSQWVNSPLSLSDPIMPANGFQLLEYAVDSQTVVVADRYNSLNASQAGRVFVYDWVGNNLNFSTELTPPGGFAANDQWGTKVAVEGDLMVVASSVSSGSGSELHIYRKISGSWLLESTVTADPVSPFFSNSFTAFSISIGHGVILIAANNASQIVVIEKIGPTWVQTPMPANSFGLTQYFGYKMNDDGLSFVAHDESGRFVLYKKGSETSTWSGSTVNTRRLLTRDLTPTRDTKVTGFSNGLIAISDSVLRKARVIDTLTSIDPINVEPIANAGADITTTSFDGGPVRVFLNGGASRDLNYNSPLSAVWTWAGGSANGLQTFANIPPSVTSIELRITDIGGAIARDTIQINIVSPPVINAGPDVSVVDRDGNGSIRLKVNGAVVSQDNPIVSWNWSWPGGTLEGQSGTITLGAAANDKPVTLTVLDSNGLLSQDEFVFRILDRDPAPAILQPVDGAPQDLFGNHVAIEDDTALISAPGFKVDGQPDGATYLSQNINNGWQQLSLSPGVQQGTGVLIDGDTAFVGAANLSREDSGQVFSNAGGVHIYQRQSGIWNQAGLLTSPEPVGFSNSDLARFGASMAKSGNWLAIGSPGANNPSAVRSGAVYLFERVNGDWTFRQKIISPDAENFSAFGFAVAISGDSLVVTSDYYQGFYDSGVAHVFTKGPTQWEFVQKLESDNTAPGANDGFGRSVAMNQTEILIGADQEQNGAGSSIYARGVVYRFSRIGSTWSRTGKLTPAVDPPTDANGFFGTALFLRDGILLTSSPWDIGSSAVGDTMVYGRVHIYRMSGGNWAFVDHIDLTSATDPLASHGFFGFSIAHDGRDLIVGAPNAVNSAGQNTGKVYIYQDHAALVPTANHEPLANAGADQDDVTDTMVRDPGNNEITEPLGSEPVTLDASASIDQENVIVSYEWNWPGGSASGVSPSARFPVGTTVVTLTITDSNNVVSSDTVSVTVLLPQAMPSALPVTTGNSLTLDLPSDQARWRLSSEFLWHGDGESATGVVDGATYQIEIIGFPGSTETITTFVTIAGSNTAELMELELPEPPSITGTVSFPETSQGFAWRLTGESAWRNVTDDGDEFPEDIEFTLPVGDLRIEFKPVAGFTTPQSRVITVTVGEPLVLDWAGYLRINSFDPARTFEIAADTTADPYQYVGMIRSPLGRGTCTVVAERVVLTAAHLFFDANGLHWADTQWFSRQQQGERQAPPVTPRGVLYQTSYAKLIAPDSVEGTVGDLPEDPQEVDFAVLYFSDETTWDQGFANFLQSTPEKNWLTGGENKHAIGYPQRSQIFENRGKMFTKQFATPLTPLGTGLFETTAVFGDGGASGSALFVQPAGGSNLYPAAILLAGQGRAVYRVIDADITRMIKDGEDAATGNDDVLNGDSSLLTFDGLDALTTIGVQVFPAGIRSKSRWTITPAKGTSSANMAHTKQVAFNEKWANFTIKFTAISGYRTPPPLKVFNGAVDRGEANVYPFTYTLIPEPEEPPPPPPPTPLAAWKQLHGITDMMGDLDKDGLVALVEYALDRNPGVPDYCAPLRNTANPSQNLRAEFDVYVSSTAAGIIYRVKASNRPDRVNPVTLITLTSADGTSGYRKVIDPQLISASPTRFAWVEVVLPSP